MGSQNALLKLYCEQGKWRELTLLYQQIRKQGFQPNSFTFSVLLKFSSSHRLFLHQGQSVHADAIKCGFIGSDRYVMNALVTMYTHCGPAHNARKVFEEIPIRNPLCWNVVISGFFHAGDCDGAYEIFNQMQKMYLPNCITWSAMISGFTQNGQPKDALQAFRQMRGCLLPNSHTISSVLSACGQLRDLTCGEQVHGYTIKISAYIENDIFVGSNLVDFYGRCGRQELARLVFNSMEVKCVVTWSILIATYVRNEFPSHAIRAFREMIVEGVEPNYITLTTLLTACARIPNLIIGKELHGFIMRKKGSEPDVFISTSLIDMYGKCNFMLYAHRILEKEKASLGCNTSAMWNATIAGYVENDCLNDAWGLFQSMGKGGGAKPNSVTMAIVLPLCARSASLHYGKEIHCYALKHGLDEEVFVGNGLLDMYSKCGKLQLAKNKFTKMIKKNRISWTSMIDGYGIHGDGKGAIRVFESMVREKDVKPDHVTFVALISACSHAGLIEEGLRYFKAMHMEYGIIPMEENYGSVVDLLARAGRLDDAKDLIATMPVKPGRSVWGAFLGACRIQGDVKEAEITVESLVKLGLDEGGFWKLLSTIYAEKGKLDSVAEVRREMREIGVEKRQGFSWLETKGGICGFKDGDKPHFQDITHLEN